MKKHISLAIITIGLFLGSCQEKQNTEVKKSNLIEITKNQFKSENMELGEPTTKTFSENIKFNGIIEPKPKGKAMISLPFMGMISQIYFTVGQKVKQGQILFDISGTPFIDLQKEFAESSAILKRLESDYNRIKELFDENIGSQKEVIQAESSFKAEKAKYTALKLKIQKIGLDYKKIENGFFYNSFPIKSPINGYITNINATIGQYIEQQTIIVEIVDNTQFQLKFSVFEKDLNKLKIGLILHFNLMENDNKPFTAQITSIGKSINNETKAIDCFAEIENLNSINLVNNQFFEGQIDVDSFSATALPLDAIIKSENGNYILSLEKQTNESYFFKKIEVDTGSENNGFIEIKKLPELKQIIVKGIYNLQID